MGLHIPVETPAVTPPQQPQTLQTVVPPVAQVPLAPPAPVVPPTPPVSMPDSARQALDNDRKGVGEAMSFARQQANEDHRSQAAGKDDTIATLQEQLRESQGKLATVAGRELEGVTDQQSSLGQQLAQLNERLHQVEDQSVTNADHLRQTSIHTMRQELLSRISPQDLPPQFHSMVQGNSPEELMASAEQALLSVRTFAQQVQPMQQMQAVQPVPQHLQAPAGYPAMPGAQPYQGTPQVPMGYQDPAQMSPALMAPEGVTQQGILPSQIGTPEQISTLAQNALATGSPQDFANFEQVAAQVVQQDLAAQRAAQGQGL